MIWPITVAGKTMPLLDLVEYKNHVEVWVLIWYAATDDPLVVRKIGNKSVVYTKLRFTRSTVALPGRPKTKQAFRANLVSEVENAVGWMSDYAAANAPMDGYDFAAPTMSYCGITICTKGQTEDRDRVKPGDKWLALSDSWLVPLTNSLVTEAVSSPACIARRDNDLFLLRQSI